MELSKINWPIFLFITIYHAALLVVAPFYFYYTPPAWGIVTIAFILYFASGISITGGYHRFYSHRTYKANKLAEIILLFFGTMAGQGSALRWSHDHRIHHAHVDTEKDPYSISKGFWYAHILWLFEKEKPIEPRVVSDLLKNKLVVFQHKYYPLLFIMTNVLAFLGAGALCNDYLGAFIVVWWLRLFFLHHCTWFINSLAHTWGSKSYCKEISAVDNYIISLLTFGEGYHNYHHSFATDYRNGIRWYHFDPTKWMIWLLAKMGLANNLKVIDTYKVQKRIIKEDKNILIEWVRQISYIKVDVLEAKIHETADNIVKKIAEMNALVDEYRQHKKQKAQKDTLQALRIEIKQMKKNLYQDWKDWLQLVNDIMKIQPLSA
ncbi:acyl-CoA desaturase [Candidatus Uabimicrobium amorphum]|uniref:Fatty acid desaturase n=1 Tax=Uabimicrobium amorphum TaxID=2596890 RepID=A0A5S9IVH1_UABAM|nr:fatty acid desaturase [Candidatus Uabimicrobium amorphum]BBM87860.1 fatty acid desaturase [Candidatus Uabimicrobium amorphum]